MDSGRKPTGKEKEWYDQKLGAMRKKLGHTKQKTYNVARINPETGQKATKGKYKPRKRDRRRRTKQKRGEPMLLCTLVQASVFLHFIFLIVCLFICHLFI